MAEGHRMTVEQLLRNIAAIPQRGEPPVKVGGRWYPRSTSDDVPEIVRAATREILDKPNRFDLDLRSSYPDMLKGTLQLLLDMVWPKRHSSDTMHKDAARYVVDWAKANDFDVVMPESVKERTV